MNSEPAPTTPLDAFLARHEITNEQWAARLRKKGYRATKGWISKIRTGQKEPSKALARGMAAESGGELRFEDLVATEPPVKSRRRKAAA